MTGSKEFLDWYERCYPLSKFVSKHIRARHFSVAKTIGIPNDLGSKMIYEEIDNAFLKLGAN